MTASFHRHSLVVQSQQSGAAQMPCTLVPRHQILSGPQMVPTLPYSANSTCSAKSNTESSSNQRCGTSTNPSSSLCHDLSRRTADASRVLFQARLVLPCHARAKQARDLRLHKGLNVHSNFSSRIQNGMRTEQGTQHHPKQRKTTGAEIEQPTTDRSSRVKT